VNARKIDVVSGPGPPRKLSDISEKDEDDDKAKPITEDHEKRLQETVTHEGKTWQRLLYGDAPLKREKNLVPPKIGGSKAQVLIYGGSPTAAWAWERYDGRGSYDMYWVARYNENKERKREPGPFGKREEAFDAARVGTRNQGILERSAPRRYIGEIANVTPLSEDGRPRVNVGISPQGRDSPPDGPFDQILVAIGREPDKPPGKEGPNPGAIDLLKDRNRPVGVRSASGDIRVLGAAGVAVGKSDLLSKGEQEKFNTLIDEMLKTIPAEAQVPPGITVQGRTIPLANDPDMERINKLNINTASEPLLKQSLMRLLGGSDAEDLATEIAKEIVKYRAGERVLPGEKPEGPWQGFETVWQLRRLDSVTEDVWNDIKWAIRV